MNINRLYNQKDSVEKQMSYVFTYVYMLTYVFAKWKKSTFIKIVDRAQVFSGCVLGTPVEVGHTPPS